MKKSHEKILLWVVIALFVPIFPGATYFEKTGLNWIIQTVTSRLQSGQYES